MRGKKQFDAEEPMSAQRSMLDYQESKIVDHSLEARVFVLAVTEFVTDAGDDEDPTPRPPSGSVRVAHRTRSPPAADIAI